MALAGLAVVCAALIADLFYTANAATWDELGLMEALVDILTETQFGTWLLVRLGVSIVLGVLLYRVLSAGTRSLGYILGAIAGLCGLLLLGRSMVSHAAVESGGLGVISVALDFVHLASASLWTGGLISLLVGVFLLRRLEAPPEVTGRVISRFSNLALISVGLIGVTGLYNAWLEVGSIQAFVDTSYGQVLLIKMGLLVPLLLLATANLLGARLGLVGSLRDHAGEFTGRVSRRLGLLVQGEVSFALMIFLMTALLANLPVASERSADGHAGTTRRPRDKRNLWHHPQPGRDQWIPSGTAGCHWGAGAFRQLDNRSVLPSRPEHIGRGSVVGTARGRQIIRQQRRSQHRRHLAGHGDYLHP